MLIQHTEINAVMVKLLFFFLYKNWNCAEENFSLLFPLYRCCFHTIQALLLILFSGGRLQTSFYENINTPRDTLTDSSSIICAEHPKHTPAG